MRALEQIEAGLDAERALQAALASDDARGVRQVGVVDASGRSAAWSGPDCTTWSGHRLGEGYTIPGNMLTGAEVLAAMQDAYRGSEPEELAERLVRELEAGQAAGGDRRGKQSACVLVGNDEDYSYVDLRVDEHPAPAAELRRVFGVFQHQVRPFLDGMPRRGAPARPAPDSVVESLLRSPQDRPGGTAIDPWTEVIGLDLPPGRRDELLRVSASIRAEIVKLRALDLTEIHPAVVFDPRTQSP